MGAAADRIVHRSKACMSLMSEIVNLNKFRKARKGRDKKAQAAENSVRFGRSKADKIRDQDLTARQSKDLDGKKLDDDT